jgi:hypothetical protein
MNEYTGYFSCYSIVVVLFVESLDGNDCIFYSVLIENCNIDGINWWRFLIVFFPPFFSEG